MREIKFRTFYKNEKEMFEVLKIDFELGIIWLDGVKNWHVYSKDCELLQYTGLKDKNKKEIFEGDVVNYVYDTYKGEDNIKGEIVFFDGQYGIDAGDQLIGIRNVQDWEAIEVIGNIYSNPELLVQYRR